jgi:hypothetical protein
MRRAGQDAEKPPFVETTELSADLVQQMQRALAARGRGGRCNGTCSGYSGSSGCCGALRSVRLLLGVLCKSEICVG